MKKVSKISIVTRIFMLTMIVICLQAALSFYTILRTDIATTVESYSFNTFTRTILSRKSNLESFMSAGWSNISENSQEITEIFLEHRGTADSLTEDQKVDFLSDSVDTLVKMINKTGSTGAFVILDDGEDMKYSYSTVYLKSYDNLSQLGNSSNLMLARGPSEISTQNNFSLVSNWSYGLELTDETIDILSLPLAATESTTNLEYLAYWHISQDITNGSLKTLTCSMPIFDENEQPIGVIGVEISQEYLYQFLPVDEFAEHGSYGYVFGAVSGSSFTPTLMNSSVQSQFLTVDEGISLEDLGLEQHSLEVEPMLLAGEETQLCVYYDALEIYPNNSPFETQNVIYLMGMVDLNTMTSFTAEFWRAIAIMMAVSLGAGTLISYLVGLRVAKPIIKLSDTVSSYDVNEKFLFDQSHIREISELSTVITQMQENILRSAHRTEKILELLNKGVGSFEYEQGQQRVIVSGGIHKMLDIRDYDSMPIPSDLFFEKLNQLKSNPIHEVAHTYAVGQNPILYYKVEEFKQGDVTLGVIEDCSKEVEDLLVLNYERNYDLLTGIFNRRAFHQRVEEVLKTEELKVAGFVMFDLDNLKFVNDTYGHDSGDVYIKTAATTIHSSLSEKGVVGRMSGDEFYAFLYGYDSKTELMASLKGLYQRFTKEPIALPNGTEYQIRVSGGIAWYGDDSTDLEDLIKYADFAMYKGKHTSKGELREFNRELYIEESFMLSGKAELDRILDHDLMNFVFQPIIDVESGQIYGYEALMRPDSEILASPLKLLQLAGLEGKLWKVEKNALFKTFSLYRKYQDLFGEARLFINSIPSENLKDHEYAQLKAEYHDCFPQIVIEITEQEQGEHFIDTKLEKLHVLELDIALDDYGSGYANDIGLINIKPNIVKIDRSIISNVHVDPSRQAIVHKIITFCKDHDICVLGEGIETEQELEYLIKAGIKLAQGYYISRPMPLPDFKTKMIEEKIAEIQKK